MEVWEQALRKLISSHPFKVLGWLVNPTQKQSRRSAPSLPTGKVGRLIHQTHPTHAHASKSADAFSARLTPVNERFHHMQIGQLGESHPETVLKPIGLRKS